MLSLNIQKFLSLQDRKTRICLKFPELDIHLPVLHLHLEIFLETSLKYLWVPKFPVNLSRSQHSFRVWNSRWRALRSWFRSFRKWWCFDFYFWTDSTLWRIDFSSWRFVIVGHPGCQSWDKWYVIGPRWISTPGRNSHCLRRTLLLLGNWSQWEWYSQVV